MRFIRLALLLLPAAGLLYCFGALVPQRYGGGGVFHDFAAFKAHRMQLPEYEPVQSRQFDLDGNGIREDFILKEGKIAVQAGSRLIWQSPDELWVDCFFLGDADNNGVAELNLLVWKQGSFGPHKPFWLEEEDTAIKNHLFIFKLEKGAVKPVWQSSALDRPNYNAALIDLDGDGENELVVAEGSYTGPDKRETTVWKWNGWGFSRVTPGDE